MIIICCQVLGEVHESVRTGLWVGDCFIYTNSVNRINYYVGGEIVTVSHLDRTMYLLGYVSKDNRLYLADKELNIVSYRSVSYAICKVCNYYQISFGKMWRVGILELAVHEIKKSAFKG